MAVTIKTLTVESAAYANIYDNGSFAPIFALSNFRTHSFIGEIHFRTMRNFFAPHTFSHTQGAPAILV